MKESSYPILQSSRTSHQLPSKPWAQHLSSPMNHSESESRMNSHFQPAIQQRKIFGFEIFIENQILAEVENLEKWFQAIRKLTSTQRIQFNRDLAIPDLNGRNIQIYDREMQKKFQSAKLLLNDVYQKFKKIKTETFSIIIFVPEGMVSLLIGTKGHQINKIMKESRTTIVVNQPISRMVYRTVKIQGYYSDVAQACRIIYEILEEKSSIAYSIEKEPSQLDYTKARVKTKFIFTISLTNFLQTRKKSVIRKAEDETDSSIKFRDDPGNRIFKRDQECCIITGKLEEVQALVVVLINLVCDYYSSDRRNSSDYTLKMLIPSNYVTKLIGQKGYMIRDIIERSGGAQIKIMSDKQSERDVRQCIIAINGTRENKIDATCLILEQIQCFKNGGPILQSGKSINENLAQQFKNSIPLRQDQILEKMTSEDPIKAIICQQDHQISGNGEATSIPQDSISSPFKLISLKSQPVPTINQQNSQVKLKQGGALDESNLKGYRGGQGNLRDPRRIFRRKPSIHSRDRDRDRDRRRSDSSSSSGSDDSNSRSRSRSREYKKRNRSNDQNEKSRDRSNSSSMQFHSKEITEMKVVVPRRLGSDHRQLKYIQSLSRTEIRVLDQKIEGSHEAIISVRGLIKDNIQCIKLLQKRFARYVSSSGR